MVCERQIPGASRELSVRERKGVAVSAGTQEDLPRFLPEGVGPIADKSISPGSRLLVRRDIYPGEDLEQYAFANTTVHRNLFRITLK